MITTVDLNEWGKFLDAHEQYYPSDACITCQYDHKTIQWEEYGSTTYGRPLSECRLDPADVEGCNLLKTIVNEED